MKRSLKKKMYQDAAAIPAGIETKSADVFVAEVKGMRDAIIAQAMTMKQELKSAAASDKAELEAKIDQLQRQTDALDASLQGRHVGGGGSPEDPLKKAFDDSPEFARVKELGSGRCTIKVPDLNAIQTKTAVTTATLGVGTPGVLNPQQVGGIVPLAQRRLFLRDLLFRGSRITAGSVFFIKENVFTNNASLQQAEGNLKSESADTFTTTSQDVKTLSHWIPISRQAMDDGPSLFNFIRNKLLFGLRWREDVAFLYGAGGSDLLGLCIAAQAFDTSLSGTTAWNRADLLRRAVQQVERNDEVPSGFFVMHPDDWANIELLKDSQGRYIVASPQQSATPQLWGKPVVVTTAMTAGHFLAGSTEAAEVHDRLDATIEVSLDYSDYRARNLAMVLCEERTCMTVYRPNAFVYGNLNSSPA